MSQSDHTTPAQGVVSPPPIGPSLDQLAAAVVGAAHVVNARSAALLALPDPLAPGEARAALVGACRLYLQAVEAAEVFEGAAGGVAGNGP